MAGRIKQAIFKFKPFSKKQLKVLSWWLPDSPMASKEGIIADGAIRSGKTLSMSLSYVMWAMATFDMQNFGMCGKTIGSFRRNVLFWLKLMLRSRGYKVRDMRADNLIIVTRAGRTNYFYIFGGKDERSQDLIQGITLAGCFFDEVALMPESFVNQATGRCSVEGSKFWFNCNPQGPHHWFKINWINEVAKKNLLYLHFTMDDNLSLSEQIKARYRSMYSGVFFQRYILGLWVVAEGVIYNTFASASKVFEMSLEDVGKLKLRYINIGIDFGGTKSKHAFVATGISANYKTVVALMSEKHEPDTPNALEAQAIEFLEKVLQEFGHVDYVYCDSAEQVLIKGIQDAMQRAGYEHIKVRNARKVEVIDRIRCMIRLHGLKRFYFTPLADTVRMALEQAVWDEKKAQKGEDVRLDDGSSDIDTLDALEYTFERDIKRIIAA